MTLSLVADHEQTYTWQVATEVRAAAARHMVSQTQIAEALGLSQMTISRRFTGYTPFDIEELEAMARLLGCEVVDFLPKNPRAVVDPVEQVRRRADNRRAARKLPHLDSNQKPFGLQLALVA